MALFMNMIRFSTYRVPKNVSRQNNLRYEFYYDVFLFIATYLLTYLFIPWSKVLLEKLIVSAASQEIPRIFGTRKFITIFTSALHLSLS